MVIKNKSPLWDEKGMDVLTPLTPLELEHVFQAFPYMIPLMNNDVTLGEYYRNVKTQTTAPKLGTKADGFWHAFSVLTRNVFPEDVILQASETLKKLWLASSAEHICSITDPLNMNVVLNQMLYARARGVKVIVSFAGASVKLDNELYSRGFYIGDSTIPFVSSSHKNKLILSAPAIDWDFCERNFQKILSTAIYEPDMVTLTREWWLQFKESCGDFRQFWQAIAVHNHDLWKRLTNGCFDYVMLPVERVVALALIHDISHGNYGWIHQAIFESSFREKLYLALNGVRSCWDTSRGTGTFLFWEVDRKQRPSKLTLRGEHLVSQSQGDTILLCPKEIMSALAEQRIVPSASLSLLYLSFYLGLNLFGGILQVNYLPQMQDRLHQVLGQNLSQEENKLIAEVETALYVNFEKRTLTTGGLLRALKPFSEEEIFSYEQRRLHDEIQGCLRFLLSLV